MHGPIAFFMVDEGIDTLFMKYPSDGTSGCYRTWVLHVWEKDADFRDRGLIRVSDTDYALSDP